MSSFNLQLIKINLYKMYLFRTYDINTNYNMSSNFSTGSYDGMVRKQ